MKTLFAAALGACLLIGFSAPSLSANSQQAKMTSCNADAKAKGLKGADRKAFMKTCLSAAGAPAEEKGNTQQEKMKSCNADAKTKGLKGADRKTFMKTCLSGSAP